MHIVINSNDFWEAPPRSKHQLTQAFLDLGIKVTFIAASKIGYPKIEELEISKNLRVIQPFFPIPNKIRLRTPGFNELFQRWLYPKLVKALKIQNVTVISSDFAGYLLPSYFRKTVYYATDDYINNASVLPLMKKYIQYTQHKLVANTAFSISTANSLKENFLKINKNSYELPLGAPKITFSPNIPKYFQNRQKPIKVVLLGYIGKFKTPISLVNKILKLKNIQLHLIGPIQDDFLTHINQKEKLIHHGVKIGSDLYTLLEKMDIGIAPYSMTDPNTGRTPNKLWQYFLVGKPVVVTNLPNISNWEFPEKLLYKANNFDQFVESIIKAYVEDNESLALDRIRLAECNSWEHRAMKLIELLNIHFKNSNH